MHPVFGVSEIQQLMADGTAHPFFSSAPQPHNSTTATAGVHEIYHPSAIPPSNKLINSFHRHYSPQTTPPPPPANFQLFSPPPGHHHHHQNHRHFQLFQNDDAILLNQSRLRAFHREDECIIKHPMWRSLDLNNINTTDINCKEDSPELNFVKRFRVAGEIDNTNYKLFSELEAIYMPGSSNFPTPATSFTPNQTTGSGSALTGDDHPIIPPPLTGDDNSTGAEPQTNANKAQAHRHHRRRRRRKKQLRLISVFFETLIKQLIDHQESLYRNFLQTMEKRDMEEDARREAALAGAQREAAARAHERELASARESSILSLMAKITGEPIILKDEIRFGSASRITTTNRWPKAEVRALIQVRTELDSQFHEPGLKSPLWEEVSSAMAAMGYHRNAKRCKEKWENINKYFRKSREVCRKRSPESKTCPYFHQLDQLYSKSMDFPIDIVAGGEEDGEEQEEEESRQFIAQWE